MWKCYKEKKYNNRHTIKARVDYRHQGTHDEGGGGLETSGYSQWGWWWTTDIRVLTMRMVVDYIYQGTHNEGGGGLETSGYSRWGWWWTTNIRVLTMRVVEGYVIGKATFRHCLVRQWTMPWAIMGSVEEIAVIRTIRTHLSGVQCVFGWSLNCSKHPPFTTTTATSAHFPHLLLQLKKLITHRWNYNKSCPQIQPQKTSTVTTAENTHCYNRRKHPPLQMQKTPNRYNRRKHPNLPLQLQ